MQEHGHGIELRHAYRGGYEPPRWFDDTLHRLLDGIPAKYISGIAYITLVNSGSFNRKRRRRRIKSDKRSVREAECLGFYHRSWRGQPASIELVVDNIDRALPGSRLLRAIRPLRDMIVGHVLYHEIGHHVHEVKLPEHKPKERIADVWSARFVIAYTRRRYWYLWPVLSVIRVVIRWFMRRRKRS